MRKHKAREHGFTYVEIIVCLCIATLIVGPLSYSFLTSVQTRVSASHIDEATAYAEGLMIEIKEKMTKDIKEKHQVEKRRINMSSWDEGKKKDIKSGAGKYLLPSTAPELGAIGSRPSAHLRTLLGETVGGDGKSELDARYNTEKYSYEVGLWRMDELPLTSNKFTLDTSTLEKATKFYTDTEAEYQFDASFYDSPTRPITFEITAEMLKVFVDSQKIYIPNYVSTQKIIDVNTINFTSQDDTEKHNSVIRFDRNEIKVNGNCCGYHYTITEEGTGVSDADKGSYTSIINVDLDALLRDDNGVNLSSYKNYTLKFTNTTRFDQVIRIGHSFKKAIDTTEKDADMQKIYDSFNITVEDKPKAGEEATELTIGKSTISRIKKEDLFDNYLMAIVVREKTPVQGEKGKIVKKMLDVYSYDIGVDG